MRRLFVFIGILCLVQSSVLGNLLINGDAESEGSTGWSLSGQNLFYRTGALKQKTGWVYPAEGDYFFTFSRIQGSYSMMSQTGLIEHDEETLTLGGYFQGEYSDYGVVTLSIYDESGVELLSESTGNMTTDFLTWETFQIDAVVPENSYSWEVTMEGFLDYGSVVNAFYDGVYLTPEPATALLLGIGAFVLRRKNQ